MPVREVGPAVPAPRRGVEEEMLSFKDCHEISEGGVLTPPALIDALYNGEPTAWVCLEAAFVEELREIARVLNRGHLMRFTECE
jgi:predicted DNA-binding ribbon-helix-helix protein